MLFYTGLLFLVIAVSLDGFTVGLAYGLQKIRIQLNSIIVIMILSGSIVFTSMNLGSFLSPFISPTVTAKIGGIILIILGLFSLYNILSKKSNGNNDTQQSNQSIPNMRTILRTPEKADLDCSGTISFNESVLLGLALSLDAFGAGFAAALLSYSPALTTILIALSSGLFLSVGMRAGEILAQQKSIQKISFAPGLLLVTIGLIATLK